MTLINLDDIVRAAGLPKATGGAFDSVIGIDEATAKLRRFPYMSGAGGSVQGYAEFADLPPAPAPNTVAYVLDDPNTALNGVWAYVGGTWIQSMDPITGLTQSVTQVQADSSRALAMGGNYYPDPNMIAPELYSGSAVSSLAATVAVQGPATNYIRTTSTTTAAETVLTPAWQVTVGKRYRAVGRFQTSVVADTDIEVVWYSDRDATSIIGTSSLSAISTGAADFDVIIYPPTGALRARFRLNKDASASAGFVYLYSLRVIDDDAVVGALPPMGGNYYQDPMLSTVLGYTTQTGDPLVLLSGALGGVPAARLSQNFIAANAAQSVAEQIVTPYFPVEPGKLHYLHLSAGRYTGVGSSTTEVRVRWYSDYDATVQVGEDLVGGSATGTSCVPRQAIIAAPTNAVRARLVVVKEADGGTRIALFDPIVRRAVDSSWTVPTDQPYDPPTINAQAGLLAWRDEADAQTNLFTKAVTTSLAPASLVKLLSAMVAIDIAAAEPVNWLTYQLTVEAGDATTGSGNNLLTDDVITLRDAISDMLLPSSNVAASVVAREMGELLLGGGPGDPVDRFITELNTKAASLGMSGTVLENAHGLPSGGQVTTAADMVQAVFAAADYPEITGIWGLSDDTLTITGVNARSIPVVSSVAMQGDADVLGGKTGTITPSNYNLALYVAMPNGNRCAMVVLAADSDSNRYIDARAIIDAVRLGHTWPAPPYPVPN